MWGLGQALQGVEVVGMQESAIAFKADSCVPTPSVLLVDSEHEAGLQQDPCGLHQAAEVLSLQGWCQKDLELLYGGSWI